MRIAALSGLAQFIDNVLRGRLVGVAHPEINNVFTPGARFLLQLANNVENVGRKSLNALKMRVHTQSGLQRMLNRDPAPRPNRRQVGIPVSFARRW